MFWFIIFALVRNIHFTSIRAINCKMLIDMNSLAFLCRVCFWKLKTFLLRNGQLLFFNLGIYISYHDGFLAVSFCRKTFCREDKFVLVNANTLYRGRTFISQFILKLDARWGWWSISSLGRFTLTLIISVILRINPHKFLCIPSEA
jgi:hypothetical protein